MMSAEKGARMEMGSWGNASRVPSRCRVWRWDISILVTMCTRERDRWTDEMERKQNRKLYHAWDGDIHALSPS